MSVPRDRTPLVCAALCAGAGALLFQFLGNATRGYVATRSLFYWWGFQWVNPQSENEHAWLVLALSAYLLWRNARGAARADRSGAGWAAPALIGGLLLHAVGYVAQQPRVSILALLLYAWGVLALGGGKRWGAAAAFPLAFMAFAIPVDALDTLGFWLRLGVVRTCAGAAHLLGMGVVRSGTQLLSADGSYQYDVAAACSGIRSLVALAALSLVVGYLWFRCAWLRAAMLLLSLPLVFLGNVARVMAVIVAAQWGGQHLGDRVHDVMGFGVFVIVLGGVLGIAEALSRARPSWAARDDPPGAGAPAAAPAVSVAPALAVAVVLLALGEAAYLGHRAARPADARAGVLLAADGANPVELPTFLDSGWMGSRIYPTAVERAILPPDTGYSRKLYSSQEGARQQVLLSVVLSGRDRTSIHRPELCLVGQGWTIDGSERHRFDYPGRPGAGFEATVLRVHQQAAGATRTAPVPGIVAYWFVGGERVVPTQGERVVYDAWNRVARGRADRWAYVLAMTGAADGADAALARVQSVLNAALPAFQPAIEARAVGAGGR